MKKIYVGLLVLCFGVISLFGADGKALANKYKISASEKAGSQWNRVFDNESKMAKLGIDKLSADEKKALEAYLVAHAADSDAPAAAGM
ncbi:MAG: hypothetical protein PHF17_07005 [Arcobacteraceae bacterium]|nr:hypothetical protein [Arcobacteraceae bacterium]